MQLHPRVLDVFWGLGCAPAFAPTARSTRRHWRQRGAIGLHDFRLLFFDDQKRQDGHDDRVKIGDMRHPPPHGFVLKLWAPLLADRTAESCHDPLQESWIRTPDLELTRIPMRASIVQAKTAFAVNDAGEVG